MVCLLLWLSVACLWPMASAFAMESDVVVSVYQGVCQEGDFSANLATARAAVRQALERQSHFLALPECFLSGYENRDVVQRGARSLDDPELKEFIAESAAHDMVVLVGLARKAGADLYNSELVIHRGKLIGFYDKVMLTGGDSQALGFKPGVSVPVFQAHGVRFAVIICHDSSFPHVALAARLQGAELLFTPHNNEIEVVSADDHRRWVRNCHIGLACQLKMVVARANNVKSDRPGRVGYGDSFILSPQGTPLAEADLFKTELITATVTPAMFRSPWVWANNDEVPAWLRTQLGQMLTNFRRPADGDELRYWLENMVVFHGFTPGEVSAATGLTRSEVPEALRKFGLQNKNAPQRASGQPLRVLPYPGGRHPRLGFFDGAVAPQRETKFSVFTPWAGGGYVVADIPEAIHSNLGLVYLAHTHVPTLWEKEGVVLERLEWERCTDGTLESKRTLPNGIAFGAKIQPALDHVRMDLWLRNGTAKKLTGLRVQNCIMLGYANGFASQTLTNRLEQSPYAAVHSDDRKRWVITAWDPVQRCWGNENCPCLHSDPQFPDCAPGETTRVRGWLSFYEGSDVESEFSRIERTGWRNSNATNDPIALSPKSAHTSVFPGEQWEGATPESQGVDARKLDEAAALLARTAGDDGARELVVIRNGRMIWKGDNIDKSHGVWSATKSFTSTVLGLLIEDGKCTLDTRAADVLPELKTHYPEVTLRHFTAMTSGYRAVGDETTGSYKHGPSNTPFIPNPKPLFTPPGSQYAYWDSAMNTFALVLTKIAGESIEEFFRRRVAEPIGMKDWDWGDYATVDGIVVNGGSGNGNKHMFITARDMARFGLLFLNQGKWNDRQLVDERWVAEATRVQVPASMPWAHPESDIDGRGVYGFNWWRNGVKPDDTRKFAAAPEGMFWASGHNNNKCFVIPEWNMVIVRLGLDGKAKDEVWNNFLAKVSDAILQP